MNVPAKSLACFFVFGLLAGSAIATERQGFITRWLTAPTYAPAPAGAYAGRIVLNRPAHFSSKIVALTFDDGPDPTVTPRILDTLAKYHAKATFFVVGKCAVRHPELLKRIVAEGHVIGNHSYSHPSKTTPEQAAREIDQTTKAIVAFTGKHPTLFRPPYGIQSGELAKYAKKRGYAVVIWNLTSADTATKNSKVIAHNVAYTPDPGDIALMHDGTGHTPTADALPAILEKLTKDGFQFVTVPELLDEWYVCSTKRQPIVARNRTIVASRAKSPRKNK